MTDLASMTSNTQPSASGGMLDGLAVKEGSAFFPVGDHLKGGTESKENETKRVGGLSDDIPSIDSTERRSPRIRSSDARWGASRSNAFPLPLAPRPDQLGWKTRKK